MIKAPTMTLEAKPGIRPAIGATTQAISATMKTLAKEFPQLFSNTLGTITQISGMAFDATQQARFEGQLEAVEETASIVGWSPLQIKVEKALIMQQWGLKVPELEYLQRALELEYAETLAKLQGGANA